MKPRIRIHLAGPLTHIEIDGQEVPGVTGVRIEASVTGDPVVTVTLIGEVHVEGDAEIEMQAAAS